jgi:hypothetical protein
MGNKRLQPITASRSNRSCAEQSCDIDGEPIRIGDRVLVLAVPTSIARLDVAAKSAFSRAVGRTIQVSGFGEDGSVELDMFPPRFKGLNTIWVEPFLVRRISWSPLAPARRTSSVRR